MGKIYSEATKILTWLGESDREIDCLFSVLQKFRDQRKGFRPLVCYDEAEKLSYYRNCSTRRESGEKDVWRCLLFHFLPMCIRQNLPGAHYPDARNDIRKRKD